MSDNETDGDDSSDDVIVEAMAQLHEPKSVKVEPDDTSCPEAPVVDPLFGFTDHPNSEADKNAALAANLVEAVVKAEDSETEKQATVEEYLDSTDNDDYYGSETDESDSDWEERPSHSKKAKKKKKVKKKKKLTKRSVKKKQNVKLKSGKRAEPPVPLKKAKKSENPEKTGKELTSWVRRFFPKLGDTFENWENLNVQMFPRLDLSNFVGKTISCYVCGKPFKDIQALHIHLDNHPRRSLSACSICGKVTFEKRCTLGHSVIG